MPIMLLDGLFPQRADSLQDEQPQLCLGCVRKAVAVMLVYMNVCVF